MSKKIEEVIKDLVTMKTPGLNRLTTKYYQAFKEKLKLYFQIIGYCT